MGKLKEYICNVEKNKEITIKLYLISKCNLYVPDLMSFSLDCESHIPQY